MKHLKEGLIKQRGVVKPNKEISNPTYEDICQEGNIVIVEDDGKLIPHIVLSEFMDINYKEGLMLVGVYPSSITGYGYWKTRHFKEKFPKHGNWINVKIIRVFKTNINPESIKTIEDLKRVLEPFKKYCK